MPFATGEVKEAENEERSPNTESLEFSVRERRGEERVTERHLLPPAPLRLRRSTYPMSISLLACIERRAKDWPD